MTYHVEYEGYYAMSWHDREENALKRWFENYKVERHASFACDTEWMIVKEMPSGTRRKKRYVCEIGDDGRGSKREVIIDHSAPPAPMLTFAAKRRYEPPPPKTATDLRKEAEYHRMMMRGYEPVRRAKYKPMAAVCFTEEMSIADMTVEVEYEIEWVRRSRYIDRLYDVPMRPVPPPTPPKHRRN